jgi:hypothetical protein
MEIVGILRALWRHRILLAVGILPAVLAALSMLYQVSPLPPQLTSKETVTGVASTRVLLSAGRQPTVELDDAVNASLGSLTVLLADLMTTDDARAELARAVGAGPREVAAFGPSSGAPLIAIPLATQASEVARLTHEPFVLTLRTDGQVPIIALRATGPDSARAAKLLEQAAVELGELSKSDGPREAKLRIEPLGPPVRSTLVDGPSVAIGVLAGLVTFLAWASAVVLVSGVARRRRARRAAHRATARPVAA